MPQAARREISALRLAAQRIATPDFESPGDVVRWMFAMQAQDFAGAKWSIGLRLPGSTIDTVDVAIERREFVRSWPMRGTLHFIRGEDLGWMLQLTSDRLIKGAATRRADLGITDEQLGVARDAALSALSGGGVLERSAILGELERAGVSVEGQRGYHLLGHLAQTGVLVLGPASGKQQTYTLLDEWVPNPRRLERDEALAELALRYFTSHGPATERDLARWATITLTDARAGIALAAPSLEQRKFDGMTYWCEPGLRPAKNAVYALPGFDEYMLGYADRSASLSPEHSNRIVPGGNGVFQSTIVVSGEVVGTWRRTEKSRELLIETDWFESPTVKQREGFERAVSRYAVFAGKPVRIAE